MNGNTDIQVPANEAKLFHDAAPGFELYVVVGMNHVLKDAPDRMSNLAVYSDTEMPLSDGLVMKLVEFLYAK